MIARIVVALIAGAALAMLAGLIVPWMIGVLPSAPSRTAFLDFELHQNSAVGLWLLLALVFMIIPSKARWRLLLGGITFMFWIVPVWTALFLRGEAVREWTSGGGPITVVALASGLLGSAAIWTYRRSHAPIASR